MVPVIKLASADAAAPLAEALVAGGLPVAEVTFRSEAAADGIRVMADRGDLLVGAGTVTTRAQVDAAKAAGAAFAVSPGLNPDIVRHAQDVGLPFMPGVCTPSDIEAAMALGLSLLKFFPAVAMGGPATLSAIAAPYGGLRFMPTGGITTDNLADFLAMSSVVACGGSWMVKPDPLAGGGPDQIRRLSRAAVEAAAAPIAR